MTLGRIENDRYREVTKSMGPLGAPKKQVCTVCRRNKSLGQYPIGSEICITCKPQPKGWRRGDI